MSKFESGHESMMMEEKYKDLEPDKVSREVIRSTEIPIERETFTVPDVHGNYSRLVEYLRSFKLVDDKLHWSGGDRAVVFMGDVIGRGDESLNCEKLVTRLQDEAKAENGEVVWLLGNHEQMWLHRNLYNLDYNHDFGGDLTWLAEERAKQLGKNDAAIASDEKNNQPTDEMFDDSDHFLNAKLEVMNFVADKLLSYIRAGRIKMAHSEGGYLFTHAGLTQSKVDQLIDKKDSAAASEEELVSILNQRLERAAQKNDFVSDPIFGMTLSSPDPVTGESVSNPGPLWARTTYQKDHSRFLNQVVAHTPTERPSKTRTGLKIDVSPSGSLISTDIGMYYRTDPIQQILHFSKAKSRVEILKLEE